MGMITGQGRLSGIGKVDQTGPSVVATVRCVSSEVPVEYQITVEYKLTLQGPQVLLLEKLFKLAPTIDISFSGIHYISKSRTGIENTVACREFGVQLTNELFHSLGIK